ncbi:sb:cb283 protein [Trichuris trichiura]|uniref:Sb:cb283 protein n=1 Tax=Trichuris trichiura TaxID=36087 RepID=A0A077Z4B7_TRITR|nr:sb:cb283 protein [Trichuris trichiura]
MSSSTFQVPYLVKTCANFNDAAYDGLLVVASDVADLPADLAPLKPFLENFFALDKSALDAGSVRLIPVPANVLHSSRLIFSATGPLTRDFDDERRFKEAAEIGMSRFVIIAMQLLPKPLTSLLHLHIRALKAGMKSILLACGVHKSYPTAPLVSLLGAMQTLYVPLEVRELAKENRQKINSLSLWCAHDAMTSSARALALATAIESGRAVARDIGGSDPERMSPAKIVQYIEETFESSNSVKLTVISDQDVIKKEYPLMDAVGRGANAVARHQSRLVKFQYVGIGKIKDTLMFVGKGVTLDTGGLNIKVGNAMNGMSRDKCGAAAVVGFFKVLDLLQPENLKVLGSVALVRNSVGPESYSCDEILTSRSGKRIRIVNTDAEGRTIMVDPLCEMRERAIREVNPHLCTIATLTGHAGLTVGNGYSIAVCNGPAQKNGEGEKLRAASVAVADIVELSRLRREDYEANKGQSEYEDLMQSNTEPSVRTPRGHTIPAAFLIMGSGLDKHGCDSDKPIKYTHIDMAAGNGTFPQAPWGCPVAALTARFILQYPAGLSHF